MEHTSLPTMVFAGVVLTVALLACTFLYTFYNAFLHPLRKFPGPFLWRCFRFPYVIAIHRGNIHRKLKQFHEHYGPVVRIAPNELSYSDGAAWKDIYASRPGHQPFKRNPTWFRKTSPGDPHSIMGFDEEAHSRFRRAFANSFSEKSLRDQSPVIESYVSAFISQLKARASATQPKQRSIDLNTWFNFLTFDVSGDLSFGESFSCLEQGRAHLWVEIVQDFGKGLALIASINQYPPIDKLLRYIIPKRIIERQKAHREMSAAKARKRLAMETQRPDFVTPTKKYADAKTHISLPEWELNMMIIVFAGSETTASALTAITRELLQNRGVLARLTREIRGAFEHENDITIEATSRLEYLNAVINEGLRLCPPVVIGVPRVVPDGGDVVCGQWVPGGTYVAFNQFPAHRQTSNFHHPNTFLPERFLHANPSSSTDNMATFQPFGIGRHSCIGVKLAYAEMRVVLARVLYVFDMALEDEGDRWDWGEQDTYIFWNKRPLQVRLKYAE